ncbi:YdcF family protein [Listeria monocytogenes]|uniref:YdcF family protein n=1 Tax=Listeria monocytogenes TaxID=1639 RepID=UPI000E760E74|nr:YdcF family protein [Listeria monocytogenes]EAE2451923.1 YdcF family protein [Listeria monocytogenes]EAF2232892.1 YdcF family protein [Listeria monocytogenes]EAG3579111.1 YdcF family protein [Listeria monocytogenes]EAW7171704.1 YdcF family protein [Listeria monocytogenes]EAW7207101.1 YdcF family protein [Listeria monocytogenes]
MVIYSLAGFFLLLFIVLSIIDRRRISNGIILTIALFFSLLSLIYVTFSNGNELIVSIMDTVLILLFLLIPFFIIGLGTTLIVNGRLMLKREGRKLANMLPLFIGLVIIILFIAWFGSILKNGSPILGVVVLFVMAFVGYFSFLFLSFLLSTFLYQFNFPRYNQDFLIVLGSGLIGGDRVPPLLASRLNRAIAFYEKQYSKTGKRATFIVSGGQGANETVSEAQAMRDYLISKGIDETFIIMEDQSVNTLQNMQFSKAKMDAIMSEYNSLFSTNNFHLFRAGLYARKAGLKSQGIGAKTALYYMPNALIREFIAITVMYKKVHLILFGLAALFFVFLAIIGITFR